MYSRASSQIYPPPASYLLLFQGFWPDELLPLICLQCMLADSFASSCGRFFAMVELSKSKNLKSNQSPSVLRQRNLQTAVFHATSPTFSENFILMDSFHHTFCEFFLLIGFTQPQTFPSKTTTTLVYFIGLDYSSPSKLYCHHQLYAEIEKVKSK